MTEKKVSLTKKDRLSVMLRSQFLQGSWNYERMQMVVGRSRLFQH